MRYTCLNNIFFTSVILFFLCHTCYSQDSKEDRITEVSMRMIGHQVLLYHGDSTSRILPIKKIDDRYRIEFESKFEFNPEELVATVDHVIANSNLTDSYLVQVEDCNTQEVVYSYVVGKTPQTDIIPCGGRDLPEACYNLLMTILEVDTTEAYSADEGVFTNQNLRTFLIAFLILFTLLGGLYIVRRTKKCIL